MNDGADNNGYRKRVEAERENRIARFERFLSADGDESAQNLDAIEPTAIPDGAAIPDGEKSGTAERLAHKAAPVKRKKSKCAASDKKENIHKGHRKRMRESARRDPEFETFSDIQILEYLLSFATPQRDTNPIAHALLDKFGSLLSVFRAPAEELAAVKGVTVAAAEIISLLTKICIFDDKRDIRLSTAADAAGYFGSVYLTGERTGVCIAYLDSGFELIAAERFESSGFALKPIVGSACRHGAKFVLMSMRHDMFPDLGGIAESVDALSYALSLVGIKFIDCLMFTDYGYYSKSELAGFGAEFVFYPYRMFVGSSEFVSLRLDSDGEREPIAAEVDFPSFVRGTGLDYSFPDVFAEVAAEKSK